MGCMNSKVEAEDKEAARINAGIEKQIRNDKKTYDRTVKILLLGLYQPSVLDELTAH
jgi:guanine nucleotide-binding protein subunit alpha, other